jgi:MFS family permease
MSSARTDTRLQSGSTGLRRTTLRLGTVALAAVAISAHFTDYGPLIPLLQSELHITSGATGLLSTLLYVGIGLSYLPGGWLVDRYGSRRVLFWSLLVIAAGGCLLPVIPDLAWIVLCRFVIGLGAGAAIVAASLAARQGRYAALGLGLFGGAMQVGAGLGLLVTPTLFGLFGWRATFALWGALGPTASILCLCTLSSDKPHPADAMSKGMASHRRELKKIGRKEKEREDISFLWYSTGNQIKICTCQGENQCHSPLMIAKSCRRCNFRHGS